MKVSFVMYGTLRKGQGRHEVLPTDKGTMEMVEISGYKMYALRYGFPGVYPTNNPEDTFTAELWTFDLTEKEAEKLVAVLDNIEGVAYNMYKREYIEVNGVTACIYVSNIPLDKGSIEIKDWNEYVKLANTIRREKGRSNEGTA